MKKFFVIALTALTLQVSAQSANYFQAGVMRNQFNKNSRFVNNYWPGWNIAAYGISISFYSGRNDLVHELPDPYLPDYKAGGSFFDFGYTKDLLKLDPFRRIAKRPIIYPTMGIGLGTYKMDDSTGFQMNLKPGLKFTPIPGISLVAQLHAGFATSNPSLKGWYIAPVFGVQFSTNLQQILGDTWTKTRHSSGGWRENEYTKSDGSRWKHTYYEPPGDYVSSYVVESRNWLNLTLKGFVGTGATKRGTTFGGGPALSLRWGMFAFDLEYLMGKVGYMDSEDKYNPQFQSSWDVKRFGFGAGIDIMGIVHPFHRPSFVRAIFGIKMGVQTLKSDLSLYGAQLAAMGSVPAVNVENSGYTTGMIQVEFGTLGFNFETFRYKGPANRYLSGFCVGVSYMIPLASADD